MKALLTVLLAGALMWGYCGWAGKRDEKIGRLNAEARADTTVRFYQGQAQVATRLVVQTNVKLAAAMRVEGKPTAALSVTMPPLVIPVQLRSASPPDSLVLRVDSAGLHLRVTAVPPPPEWRVSGKMWRDSLALVIALSCERSGAARATVAGPTWQPITLDSLRQDDAVCNPPSAWNPVGLKPPSLLWVGAIVAGVLLMK